METLIIGSGIPQPRAPKADELFIFTWKDTFTGDTFTTSDYSESWDFAETAMDFFFWKKGRNVVRHIFNGKYL